MHPSCPPHPASAPVPSASASIPRCLFERLHNATTCTPPFCPMIAPSPSTSRLSMPRRARAPLPRLLPPRRPEPLRPPHQLRRRPHLARRRNRRPHSTYEGLAEPLILVGVANTGLRRMAEYTPTRDYRLGGGDGSSLRPPPHLRAQTLDRRPLFAPSPMRRNIPDSAALRSAASSPSTSASNTRTDLLAASPSCRRPSGGISAAFWALSPRPSRGPISASGWTSAPPKASGTSATLNCSNAG